MCKIRSGATELSKPVNITVEVHEGKVDGRYSIDGKAEMPGFRFVVILAIIMLSKISQIESILHFIHWVLKPHFPETFVLTEYSD